jgi:two-component system sensor histidine kinase TctE
VPVLVAETMGKRTAALRAAVLAAALGALALALPLAALALLAIHRVLQPLQRASDAIGRLDARQLRAIDAGSMPGEVAGFVQTLNALLARLREAAGAQRAFVADAAHQLRTPWAIVRVEASELLASEHPAALQPALERLHLAAERGSRLAQQLLLSLARAEGAALEARAMPQRVDLRQLAAGSADHWLAPALQAGQDGLRSRAGRGRRPSGAAGRVDRQLDPQRHRARGARRPRHGSPACGRAAPN